MAKRKHQPSTFTVEREIELPISGVTLIAKVEYSVTPAEPQTRDHPGCPAFVDWYEIRCRPYDEGYLIGLCGGYNMLKAWLLEQWNNRP